jgi:hypothetical protein
MRASDADRERAAEVLKTGFVEGRMPKDEYDARLGQAYTAQTHAQLAAVTDHLPGGGAALYGVPAARPRTNSLAIAALCCGIAQPFTGGLSTIPAIVLGHVARGQIRRRGEEGAGLALTGLLLGWAGLLLAALLIAVSVAAFVSFAHTPGSISVSPHG